MQYPGSDYGIYYLWHDKKNTDLACHVMYIYIGKIADKYSDDKNRISQRPPVRW